MVLKNEIKNNTMFDYWTAKNGNGNSRVEVENTMRNVYTADNWEYQGVYTMDQLPENVFPFNVMQKYHCFDVLSRTEKAVKMRSESGVVFYVPKSCFFKNGKLNVYFFYEKARLENERWFNRKRGLS